MSTTYYLYIVDDTDCWSSEYIVEKVHISAISSSDSDAATPAHRGNLIGTFDSLDAARAAAIELAKPYGLEQVTPDAANDDDECESYHLGTMPRLTYLGTMRGDYGLGDWAYDCASSTDPDRFEEAVDASIVESLDRGIAIPDHDALLEMVRRYAADIHAADDGSMDD